MVVAIKVHAGTALEFAGGRECVDNKCSAFTCNICTLPQPEQEKDQHPSVGLWCASFWYRTPVQAGWQSVTPPMSPHHFHRNARSRRTIVISTTATTTTCTRHRGHRTGTHARANAQKTPQRRSDGAY